MSLPLLPNQRGTPACGEEEEEEEEEEGGEEYVENASEAVVKDAVKSSLEDVTEYCRVSL